MKTTLDMQISLLPVSAVNIRDAVYNSPNGPFSRRVLHMRRRSSSSGSLDIQKNACTTPSASFATRISRSEIRKGITAPTPYTSGCWSLRHLV